VVRIAFALAMLGVSGPALADSTAVLTGTVTDEKTGEPLAGVVVTVTSDDLLGWQTVVTDETGQYRIPNLPPGSYTLGLDMEDYDPYAQGGVELRADATLRVNASLAPAPPSKEGAEDPGATAKPEPGQAPIPSEDIVVIGRSPTVDIGSTTTGLNVTEDFARRIPVAHPTSKGGNVRSFESVGEVIPGARQDTYGVSISGTTSPENRYVIEGLSVNDPAYGLVGTPLSIEFVREVNVISGGYMPEYGRSGGGIFNVVTKSGSNEVHGSVFSSITPGAFEGPRTKVLREGSTITTDPTLRSIRDVGFDIGAPIVHDKLWFYGGMQLALTTYRLERNLNRIRLDASGNPIQADGLTQTDRIPGTQQFFDAEERSLQYIGKLTWALNRDNQISVTVFGAPTFSGGDGSYAIDPQTGAVPVTQLDGEYSALANRIESLSNDVVVKYSTAFDNKATLFDVALGWHHQDLAYLPSDGSEIGGSGRAADPNVAFRRSDPGFHSINDFESLPDPSVCDPRGTDSAVLCPVQTYSAGGPGFLSDAALNRYQAKVVLTKLFTGLGHHVAKVGLDFEQMGYSLTKAYSGGVRYRESADGTFFFDDRQFGFLQGPDDPVLLESVTTDTGSTTVGGFVQDSWSIADKVTLNAGLRYDAQYLFGDEGGIGLALPSQFSPRVGVIWDPTQEGRAKLFAHFARYYESVPLDIADRALSAEPQVGSFHDSGSCDPRQRGSCQTDASRIPIGDPTDPNRFWTPNGTSKTPIDPDLDPQSSDEIVLGGELEVIEDGRLGLSYTKRYMVNVIEDMSRDEAYTYFIGNPGSGIAADFPEATRDYDAVSLYFQKRFSKQWIAQGSYTVSYLRGNWAGLFRPETDQLDPNINADFDLKSLTINRDGPLPGDHTHEIKLFGAKDFDLPKSMLLMFGLGLRAQSGAPTSHLGSDLLYGSDEVFILPRGSGERLPWVFSVDPRVGYGFVLSDDSTLIITMDVFNVFNFQTEIARDQTYTTDDVAPIEGGSEADLAALTTTSGDPVTPNPNFGRPTEYQPPRTFRFGARVTF
jgi:outer membrane receptor protein involved in Fe transport